MFCRKCGKSIPDDSLFCPYCGGTVAEENQPDSEKEVKQNSYPYGSCGRCANPLEKDDMNGVCKNCIETAEYGRCEECGEPLDKDDGTLCKDCSDKIINPPAHKSWHSSDPVEPVIIKKQKRHPAVIAMFVVIGILCVMAYMGNSIPSSTTTTPPSTTGGHETASSTPSPPAPKVKSDLELLSSDGVFNSDINAIHITGKIKNNSGKTLSYVQIQFTLYDKSGSQVGTALANTNGLEPGNTWSYDAIGMAANISTFKVIDLSGY